jgi:Fic family protein
MVYIYKKTVAGKPQYYLRLSQRDGTRVIAKDIAYLGSSIKDVQNKLDNLKEYRQEIRKAHKNIQRVINANIWLEEVKSRKLKKNDYFDKLLEEVEACQLHFSSQFLKKNKKTRQDIFKQFAIEFSYNTTSLEGNTIKLAEAQKLLTQGLSPADRTMREIHDVQNTEKVFLEWEKYDLTNESIIILHKDLMNQIDERTGYRLEDVRVFRSRFDVTPAKYVKADMDLLLKWYKKQKSKLHPFVLACLFHHKFEKIHPFMDGNGRTGRLLFNIILMQNQYPPVIIEKKLRSSYLDALSEADSSDLGSVDISKYKKLVQFAAKELIGQYWGMFL